MMAEIKDTSGLPAELPALEGAEEILEKESKINDIIKKNGNAVSSTGFSAVLLVNNATEVKHILGLRNFTSK